MLLEVSGDVLEVVDTLPGARVRQFGGLELLLHVAGAKAEVETPVAELVDLGDVTSKQGRFVKARIEHVGPQPHCGGRRRDRRQYGKRRRRAEVVGQMQNVESQVLQALCLVSQCSARLG